MAAAIDAPTLKRWLNDGAELALLDGREEGAFTRRHLLFASPLPLSRLELLVEDRVPRRDTRIVACDDGEGLAERMTERLAQLGYTNLHRLEGGVGGWERAGFEVFSGFNVPSKAFGELVEEVCHTPHIGPRELAALQAGGANLVVLDSRPWPEYHQMNIPGGIDAPGVELLYRGPDQVPDRDTLVVVNCAGRTRSIIGAQLLINGGMANRVVALKDGAAGWQLAGMELEYGQTRRAPPPAPATAARARAAARAMAARFGVRRIDRAGLAAWRADAGRTAYLFDVRQPEEYAAGHLPGALGIEGGQLVQTVDQWAMVRNARIVLCDNDEVRAIATAHWLVQMGWPEVAVLAGGIGERGLATGPRHPPVAGLDAARPPLITPAELAAAPGALVIDLDTSRRYQAGHIPGAWFAIRARLAATLPGLPAGSPVVVTSEDGALARLAAADHAGLLALAGGTAAWHAAGLPLESGMTRLANEPEDLWRSPSEPGQVRAQNQRDYLAWELGLVEQIRRDGDARFTVMS